MRIVSSKFDLLDAEAPRFSRCSALFFVSSGANLTLRDVNISPRYIQRNPTFVAIVPQTDESEQQESNSARLLNNNQL